MQESKEKIRSRMIKNASRLWGFQDTESESSFDPLVGMIIGSLASELEKISGDIHDAESRVVEKLVELLTPEPMTGTSPAHAVIHAMPVQPSFSIYPEYQFYTYKKVTDLKDPSRTEEKSIFFTPAGSYELFNGRVRFLATSQKIFELQEEQYKDIYSQSRSEQGPKSSSLWLGLELDDDLKEIDGLSLFFELRSELHEEPFYQALSRASWSINGHPVKFSPGYGDTASDVRREIDVMLKQEMDVTAKVNNHVNRFYGKRFMTISNGGYSLDQLTWTENFPPEFMDVFDRQALENLPHGLFWVKIALPQPIPEKSLEDAFCYMNCFPAINRQLNDFTQTSRDNISIIPLFTEDSFLAMKRVTNSHGEGYSLNAFAGVGQIEKGGYIIRHGGVGRFDSRNAAEVLNYLLELIRDESAAFSVLGTDMISSSLRELNQNIARLEQRLESSQVVKENASYLMLKALPDDETVFDEFWSSNGSLANKIKAGNNLVIYEGSDLAQGSVKFMTPTVGGREKLDTEERLNAYRRALLSHDRVITAEDIKVLCYEHFGKSLEKVEISKGFMKGLMINSGFVRTIDIHLGFSKRSGKTDPEEMKFQTEDLKVKLEERSANIYPFRILIKE